MLIDFDHTQSLIIILIQDCFNGSGFACSGISKQQAVIGFLTFHKCLCILDQLLLCHLIKETFKDKEDRDEELHTNDTVQEKLSLVARFGVTIFFGKPDKKQFQEIVRQLASRTELEITEEEQIIHELLCCPSGHTAM